VFRQRGRGKRRGPALLARAARAAWRCASARDAEALLDVVFAERRGEDGAERDLGRARRDEHRIERRDDSVVDRIPRAAADGVDGGADPTS